ncbi:MAG TPA: tRNA lysidine(34) synthetase TilS [Dehalococcoidia bacterium]|jgi:tRNA(Ile)-lysidine synthase|nr:tRNA lysidine(34) synthetase TilS [Dehalococcoidia bacterium]
MSTGEALPTNRATGAFERRVAQALASMVPSGRPVVVACSGGADSAAALVAVVRARGGDSRIVAAYFDHGLRPPAENEADRDAVASLASRLECGFAAGAAGDSDLAAGGGSEAAAREWRYRWLAEACADSGANVCVTGHTLDDQAETVLLRLTRGAGTGGASGMRTLAPWPVACDGPSLSVARPLLDERRESVREYIEVLEIEPREDPTNATLDFDRNRVRHRVLPELREISSGAESALARFSNLARRDHEALEQWATREVERVVRIGAGAAAIGRRSLLALPPAIASRIVRQSAARLGLVMESSQVEQALAGARRRGARVSLAGGEVVVTDSDLLIRRRMEKDP